MINQLFDLKDKVAIITGGTGVLGGQMARTLAAAGVHVGILGRHLDTAEKVVSEIVANNQNAFVLQADVMQSAELEKAKELVMTTYGRLDILINAAGGNFPGATVTPDKNIFDLKQEDLQRVIDLNLMGTILPSKIFAEIFARQKEGVIINISSVSAQRPLTRVVGYAASKAAIDNFTRWMAVELAAKYGEGLRVNAIAPGFFIGEQNRSLLLNTDGSLSERGKKIMEHTPMGRFGNPEDLNGTLIWLCSAASKFVTGTVVSVDGGFGAFSGV